MRPPDPCASPWRRSRRRFVAYGLALAVVLLTGPVGPAPVGAEDEAPGSKLDARVRAVVTAESESDLRRLVDAHAGRHESLVTGLIALAESDGQRLQDTAIRMLGETRSDRGLGWCVGHVRYASPHVFVRPPDVFPVYVAAHALREAGWSAVGAILRGVIAGRVRAEDMPYVSDILVRIATHQAALAIVTGRARRAPRLGADAQANLNVLREVLEGPSRGRAFWPPPPPPPPVVPPSGTGSAAPPTLGPR